MEIGKTRWLMSRWLISPLADELRTPDERQDGSQSEPPAFRQAGGSKRMKRIFVMNNKLSFRNQNSTANKGINTKTQWIRKGRHKGKNPQNTVPFQRVAALSKPPAYKSRHCEEEHSINACKQPVNTGRKGPRNPPREKNEHDPIN